MCEDVSACLQIDFMSKPRMESKNANLDANGIQKTLVDSPYAGDLADGKIPHEFPHCFRCELKNELAIRFILIGRGVRSDGYFLSYAQAYLV